MTDGQNKCSNFDFETHKPVRMRTVSSKLDIDTCQSLIQSTEFNQRSNENFNNQSRKFY